MKTIKTRTRESQWLQYYNISKFNSVCLYIKKKCHFGANLCNFLSFFFFKGETKQTYESRNHLRPILRNTCSPQPSLSYFWEKVKSQRHVEWLAVAGKINIIFILISCHIVFDHWRNFVWGVGEDIFPPF